MKKLLVILLCLMLTVCFAACSNDAAEDPAATGEEEYEYVPTPSDLLEVEYEKDPSVTAENEKYLAEYSEAEALLGAYLVFPEEFDVFRVMIVDETIVQVEFSIGEVQYMGRFAPGLQENLSLLSGEYATDEHVDIAGLSVRLRYGAAKEAVADTFDSARNISISLVENTFADAESFKAVVEQFIGCLSDEPAAPAEDAPAEESAE